MWLLHRNIQILIVNFYQGPSNWIISYNYTTGAKSYSFYSGIMASQTGNVMVLLPNGNLAAGSFGNSIYIINSNTGAFVIFYLFMLYA